MAETENVSRAALRLHVSQPALSRQIRDLEDELGIPLLERSAKSVRLTDAGRVFLNEARTVLQRANQVIDAARAAANGSAGELHIGYAPSLTSRLLPAALRLFQAAVPHTRVRLHDLSTEEILAGLNEEKLQLGFLVRPSPSMLRGLQFQELTRDPLRLAVSPHHPFAKRRSVALADAARQPLIVYGRKNYPEYHDLLSRLFGAIKIKPQIVEEHDSVTSVIAAIEAGAAVAFLSDSVRCVSGDRLVLLPLTPEPEPLMVGAAWPKRRFSKAARQFLAAAKQCASLPA